MNLTEQEAKRIQTYDMWGGGTIGSSLGYGNFGKVFELNHTDGTIDAVKLVTITYDEQKAQTKDKETYLLDGLRDTLDEVRKMMEFRTLNNFVCIFGYETYPIRKDGQLEGYDVLIRMEKLTPLRRYLKEHTCDEAFLIRLGIDICTALTQATQLISKKAQRKMEFIHRDIKPGNIFLSDDGTCKLGDLGVASMSEHTAHTSVGTPSYMPPEMFTRNGYHANVDLFALGKTLEKLSEGLTLTSGLQKVIRHAEEEQPEQRYQTAQEMCSDLETCLKRLEHAEPDSDGTLLAEQHTQTAPEYTMKYQPTEQEIPVSQRRKKKKKWAWLAVIPIAAVLAAGGYFGYHTWQTQQNEAQQAAQTQLDITALHDEIASLISEKDYSTAFSRLQEDAQLVSQSEQLAQMQEQCEASYRKDITQQAQKVYHTQDNTAAMDVISQALTVLPDDEQLTQLYEAYKACDTVSLFDFAVQDTNLDRNNLLIRQTVTDTAGTTYDEALQIAGSVGFLDIKKTAGYCTYTLNQAYQYLQFCYFIQQTGTEHQNVQFRVYADDVCIYDSDIVDASQDTVSVDVDVSGCTTLRLECAVTNMVLWDKPSAVIVRPALKKKVE